MSAMFLYFPKYQIITGEPVFSTMLIDTESANAIIGDFREVPPKISILW